MRLLAGAGVALTLLVAVPRQAGALAVTVPASKNLGSAGATGSGTITAQLGTITATASGLVAPNVVASVSCAAFKTGSGTAAETVPCGAVSYWSGPATAQSGLSSTVPGQADAAHAVTLAATRTAFTANGLLLSISVSFNPTIVVHVPANAVAGVYTGTITHSVA